MRSPRKKPSVHLDPSRPGEDESLRAQVISQAPSVYITLVSVLIGLVLSDLVTVLSVQRQLVSCRTQETPTQPSLALAHD